jgi:hypothetical protein
MRTAIDNIENTILNEEKREDFKSLMKIIDAPESLVASKRIFLILSKVLPIVIDIWNKKIGQPKQESPHPINKEFWIRCNHIVNHINTLDLVDIIGIESIKDSYYSTQGRALSAVHGLNTTTPIYSLLWYVPIEDLHETYIKSQAHMLCIAARIYNKIGFIARNKPYGKYQTQAINACASLRKISESENDDIIGIFISCFDYYNHGSEKLPLQKLLRLKQYEDDKHVLDVLSPLSRLFELIYTDACTITRDPSSSRRSSSPYKVHGYSPVSVGIYSLFTNFPEYNDQESKDFLKEYDTILLDNDTGESILSKEILCKKKKDFGAHKYTNDNQIKYIFIKNQNLPFTIDSVIEEDINLLMQQCHISFYNALSQCKKTKRISRSISLFQVRMDIAQLSTILITMLMIATGRSINQLTSFKIIAPPFSSLEPGQIGYYFNSDNLSGFFVIAPDTKNIKTDRNKGDKRARTWSKHITLPDTYNLYHYIQHYQNICNHLKHHSSLLSKNWINDSSQPKWVYKFEKWMHPLEKRGRLFPIYQSNHVNSLLNDLLDSNYESHHFNHNRLTKYFQIRIISSSAGDIVSASLLTGTDLTINRTQLHYSSLSTSHLFEKYRNSIKAGNKVLSIHVPSDMPEKTNDLALCSSGCPTDSTLCNYTKYLQHMINRYAAGTTIKDRCQHHNYMTIYTATMLAFATGIRPIVDPSITVSRIDPVTGFIAISDKDGPDEYHARLIWIPDLIKTQLHAYEAHKQKLFIFLKTEVGASPPEHWTFFLLDNDHPAPAGRVKKYRPKFIKPIVSDVFPFASNVNRLYIRTFLTESNIPPEAIDAVMGHWQHGTEPWERFSSLSPIAYRNIIQPAIEKMLNLHHWRLIAS